MQGLTAQIEQAQRDLAAERARRVQAEADAAEVASLRDLLARRQAERDHATEAERVRLAGEVDLLADAVARIEPLDKRLGTAWEALLRRVEATLGGSALENAEALMALIGRPGAVITDIDRGDHDVDAVVAIQAARRQRRATARSAPRSQQHDWMAPLLRQPWRSTIERLGHAEEAAHTEAGRAGLHDARVVAARVAATTVGAIDLDAVHAWHPLPWLAEGDAGHPVAAALGHEPAREPGSTMPGVPPAGDGPLTAALAATRRASLAAEGAAAFTGRLRDDLARNAAISRAGGRMQAPWSPRPHFPHPGDALDLRHLYGLAALGAWSRHADGTGGPAVVGQQAVAAVGLNTAGLFWLPPGQTSAFVAGTPLPDEDLAEIRLPYPQVLLCCSDPIVVPPAEPGSAASLTTLDARLLELTRTTRPVSLADIHPSPAGTPVTLWEAISARGALVEAVLLLGDSLGHLDDLFAWCLAVPSATGGMLGRYVVPARRSTTRWAAEVGNLAAVAAWADWHEPDRELRLPDAGNRAGWERLGTASDFRRLARYGGAGAVRVLNVKRTTVSDPADGGTGRTLAPHARRGHWRRQHHGPGGALVKRVRVAPTLVNAGRVAMAPRVYRLPEPDTGTPAPPVQRRDGDSTRAGGAPADSTLTPTGTGAATVDGTPR
ncbi:hypothetical protein ACFFX1_10550 [Dactylosporangium sucinum]|uniref:hypothetical protein n=1 Tax=Dactylosporangium sucinum TaxID=1424081 RepID=UPI00167E4B1F|nr:hypothetical protein [Dactylosporangium sucinum]